MSSRPIAVVEIIGPDQHPKRDDGADGPDQHANHVRGTEPHDQPINRSQRIGSATYLRLNHVGTVSVAPV